jgi:uncharacterized protein (DUF302 family)
VFYIIESSKSFAEACFDLEPVVQRLGFIILQAHKPGESPHYKAFDLDDDFQSFAISNDRLAERLLACDMRACLLAPWRIAIYTENGATKLGLIRPTLQIAALGNSPKLRQIASELEERMIQIVDETR